MRGKVGAGPRSIPACRRTPSAKRWRGARSGNGCAYLHLPAWLYSRGALPAPSGAAAAARPRCCSRRARGGRLCSVPPCAAACAPALLIHPGCPLRDPAAPLALAACGELRAARRVLRGSGLGPALGHAAGREAACLLFARSVLGELYG